ncbi:MAG: hypothetical protein R3C45_12795 [Phycisphaerales bacterium]
MKRPKQLSTLVGLVGLVLAALGIGTPIAWDWYKNRRVFEVQYISRSSIIEDQYSLDKLTIEYDGIPIRVLSRLTCVFVNSGKTPILPDEFIAGPSLVFKPGVRILDAAIESKQPNDLEIDLKFIKLSNVIEPNFSLMNPGDFVRVSLLVDGDPENFDISARIVGVSKVRYVDKRIFDNNPKEAFGWTFYVVAVFTGICALLVFGGVMSYLDELAAKRKYLAEGQKLPRYEKRSEYQKYIDKQFSFDTRRKHILDFLPVGEDVILSENQIERVEENILKLLRSNSENLGMFIVVIVLTAIGVVYILANIFTT